MTPEPTEHPPILYTMILIDQLCLELSQSLCKYPYPQSNKTSDPLLDGSVLRQHNLNLCQSIYARIAWHTKITMSIIKLIIIISIILYN